MSLGGVGKGRGRGRAETQYEGNNTRVRRRYVWIYETIGALAAANRWPSVGMARWELGCYWPKGFGRARLEGLLDPLACKL